MAWEIVNVEGLLLCEAWARKGKGINRLSSGEKIGQTFAWLPYAIYETRFPFIFLFFCVQASSAVSSFFICSSFSIGSIWKSRKARTSVSYGENQSFPSALQNISLHLAPYSLTSYLTIEGPKRQTFNTWDIPVVTHPGTSRAACDLSPRNGRNSMASRSNTYYFRVFVWVFTFFLFFFSTSLAFSIKTVPKLCQPIL